MPGRYGAHREPWAFSFTAPVFTDEKSPGGDMKGESPAAPWASEGKDCRLAGGWVPEPREKAHLGKRRNDGGARACAGRARGTGTPYATRIPDRAATFKGQAGGGARGPHGKWLKQLEGRFDESAVVIPRREWEPSVCDHGRDGWSQPGPRKRPAPGKVRRDLIDPEGGR